MSKQKNNFVFWMIALIAVGLLTLIMVKLAMTPKDNNPSVSDINPISATDHVKGNTEASITIVEYSDFQCPACAQYFNILQQINQDFGDKIKFVYRHFPLKTIHPNAYSAALTAEAASLQGKFWEMHDQLFINQSAWSPLPNPDEAFLNYAQAIGLDINKFQEDLKNSEGKNKVDADLADAYKNNLPGTPTFFINGERINPRSYNDLADEINKRLNQ